jgi:release factor glutamine methyltransferase
MTRGELTRQLAALLGATHEARFIVEDVVGSASDVSEVSGGDVEQAMAWAERRRAGEPLQYILGHWAFRSLDLLVDPRVLIPRPETEQLVEVALLALRGLDARNLVVVDAGTGSGAIALSVAVELAASGFAGQVYATDASAVALDVARANLERVCSANGAMVPVTFRHGNWLEPLPAAVQGSVSLVVSNPPYVAEAEWVDLPPDVKAEPRHALVAGAGSDGTPGLADVEEVLWQSLQWLSRPGRVVIELAPHQADAAVRLAKAMGYDRAEVAFDLAGRQRILVCRLG